MRIPDPANTVEQQLELLRLLRQFGPQTRRQIAERTGHSLSQVRQLTQGLVEQRLLIEHGIATVGGAGRPSQVWSVAPDACYAVGLDVGGAWTHAVVLDALGRVLVKRSEPTTRAKSSLALLHDLRRLVEAALSELGARCRAVRGLGVAFSGFVDYARGKSLDAPNIPHAHALPLHEYLSSAFRLPIVVDDSSRAMALAELRYGAARYSRNFIGVNVGVGIGAGIVVNGQLYRGALGLAGELGHIPVMPQGPPCSCGRRGCLETLASGRAIAARARALLEQGTPSRLGVLGGGDPARVTAEMVSKAALEHDDLALRVLDEAGTWLSVGLAVVINLFSPDLVVLTGGVMRGNHLLLSIVQREIDQYILPLLPHPFPVVLTWLDENVGALGAATLILDQEFEGGFADRMALTATR